MTGSGFGSGRSRVQGGAQAPLPLGTAIVLFAAVAGLTASCGDSEATPSTSTSTTTTSSDTTTGTGGGGTGGDASTTTTTTGVGGQGGGGGSAQYCVKTAPKETRGSAIALSPDEATVVAVNRDVGSVSVFHVDYGDGQPALTLTAELDLGPGSEPWQVAIDGCSDSAYVVLRKDQQLVAIHDISRAPIVGDKVAVGSEPTAVAISPNNRHVYVANWVDGTVSDVDPVTLAVSTIDLNGPLVSTNLLGAVTPRPGLAHPRAIAITNNGDTNDDDESVLITEWFAQRTAPESADGKNSDTNKTGLIYKVGVGGGAPTTIQLPPVVSTGFVDHNNGATGCFPNQVGAISIDQGFAYVTSTCASPVGPIGVFQKGSCTSTAGCSSFGAGSICSAGVCTLSCVQNSDCAAVGGSCSGTVCAPNTTDVKTTTHPAVSIVDLASGTATTTVLDALFSAKASTRMPHRPADVGFFNGFGYVAATGADGVFRLVTASGVITDVGSATNNFINLRKDATDTLLRNPIGIATGFTQAFAFVANDGSRDVTALSFNVQAIAGNQVDDFRITQSSSLPAAGSKEDKILRGKRFFGTGLGRWSLKGEAWGSCAACHEDGLSDNVTWYFARGPRQSVSLDGSFASNDASDQRIFNWTAIFDEVADFEANIRGVSGGVGAIVSTLSSPPANSDRINTAAEVPPQQGLQGSSNDVADPLGQSAHPHSKLADWEEVEAYIQSIRSPRSPTNLVQADIDAGKDLFDDPAKGNCVGCHSGAKWTISKVFFPRGDIANAATADAATTSLSNQDWSLALNGFPAALFPIRTSAFGGVAVLGTDSRMRFGAAPAAEQIQCILRPVGTFGVSAAEVNVVELRQDMATAGQGNADTGQGFNPPSLLGLSVGAPYFHAGNARTLEEAFDAIFVGHHTSAVAQVFVPDPTKTKQLVAYLLSIDEETLAPAPAAKNGSGGDICSYQ